MSPDLSGADARLDHQLNEIGWGFLLILTGLVWLVPAGRVPNGAWLYGVAAILLGVNLVRYAKHIAINGFSMVLGFAALLAAISQNWRTDIPLLAICFLVIGASLVARPFLKRTS